MINTAWSNVKPELIQYCFNKSGLVAAVSEKESEGKEIMDEDCNILEEDEFESDPNLIIRTRGAGVNFPESVSMRDYFQIDSGLYVTDYSINDNDKESQANTKTLPENEGTGTEDPVAMVPTPATATYVPDKGTVLNSIETIRNWLIFSKSTFDPSLHTALSSLENFAMWQEPEPEPTLLLLDDNDELKVVSDDIIVFHAPGTIHDDADTTDGAPVQKQVRSSASSSQLIHLPINIPNSAPGSTRLTLTIDPSNPSHQEFMGGGHRMTRTFHTSDGPQSEEIQFQVGSIVDGLLSEEEQNQEMEEESQHQYLTYLV
jgi:hypothetical protein